MNRLFVRNLLLLILSVALIAGIAYLLISPLRTTSTDRCQAVTVEVKSESGGAALFLTGDRIADELARRGIQLRGKRLDSRRPSSPSPSTRVPKPLSPPPPHRYRYASSSVSPSILSRRSRVRATTSHRGRAPSRSIPPSLLTSPSSAVPSITRSPQVPSMT